MPGNTGPRGFYSSQEYIFVPFSSEKRVELAQRPGGGTTMPPRTRGRTTMPPRTHGDGTTMPQRAHPPMLTRTHGGGIDTSGGGARIRGAEKRKIQKPVWQHMLSRSRIMKKDMNALVVRFLVDQGYDDAAKSFITESVGMDLRVWTGFLEVQKTLKSGNLEDAVEKLMNLNPEILDKDHTLVCALLHQEFIELIRTGKVAEALKFSQEKLAPFDLKHPTSFKVFSEITSLLSFKDDPSSPAAKYLDNSMRIKAANRAQQAFLVSQGIAKDWNIPRLLKDLVYYQMELDKVVVYPRILNLRTAEPEPESEVNEISELGGNDFPELREYEFSESEETESSDSEETFYVVE